MLDLGVEIMAGLFFFFFFLEGSGMNGICLYQSISTVLFLGMIGKSYQ